MSLLAMAIWDTIENGRSKYTNAALESLYRTVDWGRHRLVCVDNGSCYETKIILDHWEPKIGFSRIENEANLGQASAINQAWRMFDPEADRHVARVDNDIKFMTNGWMDVLEEVIERDEEIGLAALKHPDLVDCPEETDWRKTSYHTVPHKKGQKHIVVERMNHCLGSAQLISRELFDRIGYLRPYGLYGSEDVDYCVRCKLAGLHCVYVHGLHFYDLDQCKNEAYQKWKEETSSRNMPEMDRIIEGYRSGRNLHYSGKS